MTEAAGDLADARPPALMDQPLRVIEAAGDLADARPPAFIDQPLRVIEAAGIKKTTK